jgi:tripartite-type tricarboxylate transporter receptor subunit TctC
MAKNPRDGWIARLLALVVACIVALASTCMAKAQGNLAQGNSAHGYPAHPITIIVPFAAGGPTDTLARVLAQRMTVKLGQGIVIENVSGASGSIGVGRVARAIAGWLYAQHRQRLYSRLQRRHLSAAV